MPHVYQFRKSVGISALDFSADEQHLIVSLHLPPKPPTLSSSSFSSSSQSSSPPKPPQHHCGKLLLFDLPHTSSAPSSLGYYIDYAYKTAETVKDVFLDTIDESKEFAKETINMASDKLLETKDRGLAKLEKAKSKINSFVGSIVGSLFKKKKDGDKETKDTKESHSSSSNSSSSSSSSSSNSNSKDHIKNSSLVLPREPSMLSTLSGDVRPTSPPSLTTSSPTNNPNRPLSPLSLTDKERRDRDGQDEVYRPPS